MGFPLPDELTGWVFNHLDVPSLLRCMQVCKLFHSIISMSIRLVYKIELYVSYLEDNKHSSLETVNRLNLLREYNRVWHHMDWASSGSIPMASGFRWKYSFSGGILAQSTRENTTLSFVQLPCKLKGIPERTWSVPFDFRIRDFALDNSQDLIVLLELVGTSPNMSCNIHLRTLSGEQHPRTTVTKITYSSTSLRNTFFAMQICGDHVAVLFYAEHGISFKNAFFLWNWRTGQQELCIHAAGFTSYAFMTEDLILAANISPDTMEPVLQVLRLTPHVDSVPSLVNICQLLFPMIRGNTDYLSIRSEPPSTWKLPAGLGVPFYTSQKDTIFTISFCIILDDSDIMRKFDLFVPLSTLLLEVERSHGVLHRIALWDTWGPDGTRLLFMKPSATRTGYAYGMKFIQGLRRNNGHVARVYDFNPYAARKHAETSADSSTPWKRLARQSKFSASGRIFYKDVVTRLPGRVATITLEHSDEGWEAAMIGEDHIVMVQSDYSKYGYMAM
ncbi:hypothetical protein L210DRAFT_3536652 [Boletus edulis BED1]|uniref:F-box domain-containing protein n=1 Tax=Boletus edulis BED1 TaxID=1328754 RepID=A0AAD4BXT5_BOLED|nr:hypothetical protein L210DRAFT_3536652 [Boletus edulis BED1]